MTPLQYVGIGSAAILISLGTGFFVGRANKQCPQCVDTSFLVDSLRHEGQAWKQAADMLAGDVEIWKEELRLSKARSKAKSVPDQISDAYHYLYDLPDDSIADRMLADPPTETSVDVPAGGE